MTTFKVGDLVTLVKNKKGDYCDSYCKDCYKRNGGNYPLTITHIYSTKKRVICSNDKIGFSCAISIENIIPFKDWKKFIDNGEV
jgi:hypothetical protein